MINVKAGDKVSFKTKTLGCFAEMPERLMVADVISYDGHLGVRMAGTFLSLDEISAHYPDLAIVEKSLND